MQVPGGCGVDTGKGPKESVNTISTVSTKGVNCVREGSRFLNFESKDFFRQPLQSVSFCFSLRAASREFQSLTVLK